MPMDAVEPVRESFASSAALRHPWAWARWFAVTNEICPQLKYRDEDMRYYPHSDAMMHQTLFGVGIGASMLVGVTG